MEQSELTTNQSKKYQQNFVDSGMFDELNERKGRGNWVRAEQKFK